MALRIIVTDTKMPMRATPTRMSATPLFIATCRLVSHSDTGGTAYVHSDLGEHVVVLTGEVVLVRAAVEVRPREDFV